MQTKDHVAQSGIDWSHEAIICNAARAYSEKILQQSALVPCALIRGGNPARDLKSGRSFAYFSLIDFSVWV